MKKLLATIASTLALGSAIAGESVASQPWPFDQAPDAAAITTTRVLARTHPILSVVHYADDHSWAFTCGTTNDTADAAVISMEQALDIDPTLKEIADLPPGFKAWRKAVGQPWVRLELK